MRIIQSVRSKPAVSEKKAEAIQQAILRGKTIIGDGNVDTQGAEACLIEYTDPADGSIRYAVEVWSGTHKWIRDAPEQAEAMKYYRGELDRLGIG